MSKRNSAYDNPTPGFAIRLKAAADLGAAMLIAKDAQGNIQPVSLPSTLGEAAELAADHLKLSKLDPAGFQPVAYQLWVRGLGGEFKEVLKSGLRKLW
jgi:hypothetical protein